MSGRTYVLDADMCDAWVTSLGAAHATVHDRLLDAIRAQQPKPRIPWRPGLRVRDRQCGDVYLLTDERRERRAVIIETPHDRAAGLLVHNLQGVGSDDTLDPAMWTVVE